MLPTIQLGSLFISELIGKEIISDTYKSINNSVTSIHEFNEVSVNIILEELDILKKIEIVNSLFNEIEGIGNKTKILALNNLHEISDKIKEELQEIKKDIKYSQTLYLASWRNKPYLVKLKKLRNHCSILDNRLDLVLKLG